MKKDEETRGNELVITVLVCKNYTRKDETSYIKKSDIGL